MISGIVFPVDLVLRRDRRSLAGHEFIVGEEGYSIEYEMDGYRWGYVVPAGFATDLASVPWGFRNVASKLDGVEASIVHDHAYATGSLPRDVADALFLAILEASGIGWFKRNTMYAAVRAGGWSIYGGEPDGLGPMRLT